VLAPMAGVTDQPFRKLCRQYGAALTPSEMITSNVKLWNREKCRLRRSHDGEESPRVVQIAGADPAMMAEAAALNVEQGAQIIDINMGCPAKKVLKRSAGSALMQYPALVEDILTSVVNAVDVPVTLKIRTGWDIENRNGVQIAQLAEDCGIQALAVHGRTRACGFKGNAEYDTIASIKTQVSIPVFANGDINDPAQAALILEKTGVDGLMIGRGAQGRPWIFSEIDHFLAKGHKAPPKPLPAIRSIIVRHLQSLYDFYGPEKGIGFARKHLAWYLDNIARLNLGCEEAMRISITRPLRQHFNQLNHVEEQLEALENIFQQLDQLALLSPEELAA